MRTGFTFADIFDEVVSRTGGEQSTAEDVAKVRRSIRIVLERWEAKGLNTWRVRSSTIYPTGASRYVELPSSVDDILMVTPSGGGSLTRINSNTYMAIGSKDQDGKPGEWWLDRTETPRLYLYPTGDSSALEIWYVERPEHYDDLGDNMHDVPGRWLAALIACVAHDFAKKRPGPDGKYDEALISRLKADADEDELIARQADRDRARFRYRAAI